MSNKKGVYIIQFGDSQSMKVGRTTNLEKRKQQLQTANSEELKVVRFYETEHHVYLEGCLHRFLKDKHKRLEFYTDININEVDNFVDLFNNVIEFKPNFDNYDEKELRLFFIKLLGGEQDRRFDENGEPIDYNSDDEHLRLKFHVECDEDYENAIEIKNRLKWFNVYDNIEDVDFIGWKGDMFIQIKMKHYRKATSYWFFSEQAVISGARVFGVSWGKTTIPLNGLMKNNKKHIYSEKYNVVLKPDYHVFVDCSESGIGTISILSLLMIINNLFYFTKNKKIMHTDNDVKKMTYVSKLKYVELSAQNYREDYDDFWVQYYYNHEKDKIINAPTFYTADEIETFLNENPHLTLDYIKRFDNNFGIT